MFLINIIENTEQINKLSRESLIKLVNLIPTYYNKNIIQLIDEIITEYENSQLIEISNIRLNDLKSEIFKTKYKLMKDFLDFKIYEYENYNDVFFTGKEINIEKLLEKLKTNLNYNNFEIIHLSSRTIKTAHIIKINKTEENKENINKILEQKLKKIKRIETIRLRFYFKEEKAPQIEKKKKNKNH